jgi:hypothetical protein
LQEEYIMNTAKYETGKKFSWHAMITIYISIRIVLVKRCTATAMQATRGRGGMNYSSYSYLTWALDGDQWSASCPGRALPPGKYLGYHLYRRLGDPQAWYGHTDQRKKSFASAGIRTPVVHSVDKHYTDCSTVFHKFWTSWLSVQPAATTYQL